MELFLIFLKVTEVAFHSINVICFAGLVGIPLTTIGIPNPLTSAPGAPCILIL